MGRSTRGDLNMGYNLGMLLLYFYVSKHFVVICFGGLVFMLHGFVCDYFLWTAEY